MNGKAVALDRNPLVRVGEVQPDSTSANHRLVLAHRSRQPEICQHLRQQRLKVALGGDHRWIQIRKYSPSGGDPVPTAPRKPQQAGNEFVDSGELQVEGLVDQASKANLVEPSAEVDQRASRSRALDSADHVNVPLEQVAGPVKSRRDPAMGPRCGR